ncbi:hypothetical protein BHM03_00044851, partial [Ensete ventricosum]
LKIFAPISVLAFGVLVPVNWTGGTLENNKDLTFSDIDKLSISNIQPGSERFYLSFRCTWLRVRNFVPYRRIELDSVWYGMGILSEDLSEEVATSSLKGVVVPRFSSSTAFGKDEGCRRLRPSTKKKSSSRLTIRGRHRPKVLPLLLPLSLSSSFSLVASSSLAVAKPQTG